VEFVEGFWSCTGLVSVNFGPDSQLEILTGFGICKTLRRLDIPASVEVIKFFTDWTELRELILTGDSHIRKINGF
jgi:hypothetical protein